MASRTGRQRRESVEMGTELESVVDGGGRTLLFCDRGEKKREKSGRVERVEREKGKGRNRRWSGDHLAFKVGLRRAQAAGTTAFADFVLAVHESWLRSRIAYQMSPGDLVSLSPPARYGGTCGPWAETAAHTSPAHLI